MLSALLTLSIELLQLLEFLLALQIPNVTVYAFAIDNFNRPSEEVDGLMDLASRKLLELGANGNILDRYGVRINVIGRKDLLPEEVQRAVAHVEKSTEGNTRLGGAGILCSLFDF